MINIKIKVQIFDEFFVYLFSETIVRIVVTCKYINEALLNLLFMWYDTVISNKWIFSDTIITRHFIIIIISQPSSAYYWVRTFSNSATLLCCTEPASGCHYCVFVPFSGWSTLLALSVLSLHWIIVLLVHIFSFIRDKGLHHIDARKNRHKN